MRVTPFLVITLVLSLACDSRVSLVNYQSTSLQGDNCDNPIIIEPANNWRVITIEAIQDINANWYKVKSDCAISDLMTDDIFFQLDLDVTTIVTFTAMASADNLVIALFHDSCPIEENTCITATNAYPYGTSEILQATLSPGQYLAVVFDYYGEIESPVTAAFNFTPLSSTSQKGNTCNDSTTKRYILTIPQSSNITANWYKPISNN